MKSKAYKNAAKEIKDTILPAIKTKGADKYLIDSWYNFLPSNYELDEYVDSEMVHFHNALISTRKVYVDNYQPHIKPLLEFYMRDSDYDWNTITSTISAEIEKNWTWIAIYIHEDWLSQHGTQTTKTADYMFDIIVVAFEKAKKSLSEEQKTKLITGLRTCFKPVINLSYTAMYGAFVMFKWNSSVLAFAHYPELCLAWLRYFKIHQNKLT